MVKDCFGRQPICHDPEAAIAKGAALIAFDYSQKFINFYHKNPNNSNLLNHLIENVWCRVSNYSFEYYKPNLDKHH